MTHMQFVTQHLAFYGVTYIVVLPLDSALRESHINTERGDDSKKKQKYYKVADKVKHRF